MVDAHCAARRGTLDGQGSAGFRDGKMVVLRAPAARRVVEAGTDVKKPPRGRLDGWAMGYFRRLSETSPHLYPGRPFSLPLGGQDPRLAQSFP